MINQKKPKTGQPSILLKLWHFKFFMIFMVIATIFSCSRSDEVLPDTTSTKGNTAIITRSPSYIGDRLYFADFDEFRDYYLELDDLLEDDQDLFDSIVNAHTPV
jgi:hypothetical protein